MGHVLLVMESPRCIRRHTTKALPYAAMWPAPSIQVMWTVKTMESTSAEEGYHESQQLLFVDETGRILLVGEEPLRDASKLYKLEISEPVQLWQCPRQLRANFQRNVMREVLAQMKSSEMSWSWSTAARAVFMSAEVSMTVNEAKLQMFKNSWKVDPIC